MHVPRPIYLFAVAHEYLHKNSSATDIANVKRRVVEASRTDADDAATELLQAQQAYPLVYSQPRLGLSQSFPQPTSTDLHTQHRHGLSFEYEDAQQPMVAAPSDSHRWVSPNEQQMRPVPRHQQATLQSLRQQPYYETTQAPPASGPRHQLSSTYDLPPVPQHARQQSYDPYGQMDEYESVPVFHPLRHQASFRSDSSATSSVYEMEGSSNSEIEMGYRTPPRICQCDLFVHFRSDEDPMTDIAVYCFRPDLQTNRSRSRRLSDSATRFYRRSTGGESRSSAAIMLDRLSPF